MSETAYLSPNATLVSDAISTGNIAIQNDLLKNWMYLTPNVATANTIVAGLQRYTNTVAQSFWSNIYSPNSYVSINVPNDVGGSTGQGGWSGAVTIPDGRVLVAPQIPTVTSVGIFNPVTNQFTTVATGTGVGTNYVFAFSGAVSPDGRVIFCPFRTTAIGIFNPVTNAFTTTTGGLTANPGHAGTCVLPNGQIMFAPYDSAWIGLFNPATGVYTTGPSVTGYVANSMAGCVPLPNGNVVLLPQSGTYVGVYNYITNTVTTTNFSPNLAANGYFGGGLLPDGTVLLVPFTVQNIGIYNPNTNSFTKVPISGTGHFGGRLLPNGNFILNPYNSTYYGIYDYRTRTYTSVTASGALGGGTCQSSGLLADGRVIFPPWVNSSSCNMGVFSGNTVPVDRGFLLSPLLNHGG